nr:MAG TPA: hypothetical protein [Bacteriophage sp.]
MISVYLFRHASNSHVDGFREIQITNNLFPFSVYMRKRRHRESNTNNISVGWLSKPLEYHYPISA